MLRVMLEATAFGKGLLWWLRVPLRSTVLLPPVPFDAPLAIAPIPVGGNAMLVGCVTVYETPDNYWRLVYEGHVVGTGWLSWLKVPVAWQLARLQGAVVGTYPLAMDAKVARVEGSVKVSEVEL